MAFNTEALGRRIGEIRRRRGLSQMALAEQIEKEFAKADEIANVRIHCQRAERISGCAFDRQH